jgi:VWFA-related protein
MRLAMTALLLVLLAAGSAQAQRPRPPRPERLDAGIEYRRDAATGELRLLRRGAAQTPESAPSETAAEPATIRVRVELVDVSLNVLDREGNHIRGLARDDFRVFEEGAEHPIAHFDAATRPASVALVIDASPSVLREFSQMKQAARALGAQLAGDDEVAVVAFAAGTYLLLPFTRDRALLERSLDSLEVLRVEEKNARGSNVYEAVFLAADRLFRGRTGRKALVLFTDGQDSGLGLGWDARTALPREAAAAHRLAFEDLLRTLTALGVEVHAVSNQTRPRAMTDDWLAENRLDTLITTAAREAEMTHYTLWLAELVRRAGGRLYFLRELGALADAYRRIAETLRAQYTLGYYPQGGFSRPGWRALRIEVRGRSELRLTHRVAYYVPTRRSGTTDEH